MRGRGPAFTLLQSSPHLSSKGENMFVVRSDGDTVSCLGAVLLLLVFITLWGSPETPKGSEALEACNTQPIAITSAHKV